VDIFWLGHSCFRVKGKDTSVILDPVGPDTGYSAANTPADVVTVSHSHPGHSYLEGVTGEYRVLSRPGEYEVKDVLAVGWRTFHDNTQGSERGQNTVFRLEIEGLVLCHFGDIGHVPSAQMMAEIGAVDVLFVPAGGHSTLPPNEAAAIVRQLSPKIVIPMHYKTPATRRPLEAVDRFLTEMAAASAVPQAKLTVSRVMLPVGTQVVVLAYPQK
jgi:L-ascorbate metabolism protein UlaG (beta-lactamase superfamily)